MTTAQLGDTRLGDRFEAALRLALRVHGQDQRKVSGVPYLAHLLSVCSLVLNDGGSEDEAIAALLHDTLEDHPQEVTRQQLEDQFGPRVRRLVEVCTDTPVDYSGGPRPEWHGRKRAYLEHIGRTPPADLRVPLADKLDNARAMLADYRQGGAAIWAHFTVGQEGQLWFYGAAIAAFRQAGVRSPLLEELSRVVEELERVTG
jgi:(p)ppGpp synthase/HD superfamily hydrolase